MAWLEQRNTKRGRRWYVYWRGEDGKRKSRRAGENKSIALRVKEKVEKEQILKTNSIVDTNLTLQKAWDCFLDYKKTVGVKRKTIVIYNSAQKKMYQFFSPSRELATINKVEIQKFKKLLTQKHNPAGANIILRCVRAFFSYSHNQGLVFEDPASGLKQEPTPQIGRMLTPDEVKSILDYGCAHNKELQLIVKIFLHTGLRKKELLSLTEKDYDGSHLTIRAETSKVARVRRVFVASATKEDLEKVIAFLPRWDADRLTRAFARAVERCRKKGLLKGRVRIHDLRHTAASYLIQYAGLSLHELSKVLGHAQLSTTQIYAHLAEDYLSDKIKTAKMPI